MIAVKKFAKLQFLCILSKSLPLTPGFGCASLRENRRLLTPSPSPEERGLGRG